MEIKELIQKAHTNADSKGFWNDYDVLGIIGESSMPFNTKHKIATTTSYALISSRLMLIVGEVAEAQEGLRKNNWNNFKEELADVAIRLADLCGGLSIDLEAEIIKKMEKNKDRSYLHGKAF